MPDALASEIESLFPGRDVDRRRFMMTSLGAGFALAVLPVGAQTIATSADGLVAGEVKVPAAGGDMPTYRAMPASGGPFPVVLVVSEVWGAHEHIRDVARRFAKLGYFAMAPELFAMYAAHNPDVDAAIAWYGATARAFVPGDKLALDVASATKVPVLGLYGGADGGIPNETVEKYFAALKAAGNTRSELVIYPETPHAFFADYRPSYRKDKAEDAWARATAFLGRHLN